MSCRYARNRTRKKTNNLLTKRILDQQNRNLNVSPFLSPKVTQNKSFNLTKIIKITKKIDYYHIKTFDNKGIITKITINGDIVPHKHTNTLYSVGLSRSTNKEFSHHIIEPCDSNSISPISKPLQVPINGKIILSLCVKSNSKHNNKDTGVLKISITYKE